MRCEQAFDWICSAVSAIHLSLIPPSCRYYPTCSSYMIQAIQVHGAGKGSLMGISRILRCHPFVKGGIDYVPQRFTLKRNTQDQEQPTYRYRKK